MKAKLPERFFLENYFYFDTSSLNRFIDNPNHHMGKTQNLWTKKKRTICISAVNLYEIFQNSKIERKEEILHKIGILCFGNSGYFDIPTRILFGEILGYTTEKLTESEEKLRDLWFDVKNDPENITINLDYKDFSKRRVIYKIFEKSARLILKENLLEISKDDLYTRMEEDFNLIGAYVVKLISSRFDLNKFNQEMQLKSFLIFLIFCFGIEPESSFLEEYWKNKENFEKSNELQRTLNRMMKLLREHDEDTLFNNMFIQTMVDYIIFEHVHTKKKIMASTLSDALHLIYSFYAFNFVTDDSAILDFSKNNPLLEKRVFSVEKDFFMISKTQSFFLRIWVKFNKIINLLNRKK